MSPELIQNDRENTIYTVTANCQDCYRCVRACPVKAIRVTTGQAQIEDKLCIKCGTCVRECPQHAKTIRSSLEPAKKLIKSEKTVVVTVAPSFPAVFSGWRAGRLPSALRRLGFHYVTETAEGAKYVTEKSFMPKPTGNICTACPAVVNYIEKYKPEWIDAMIPVVSPMVAHGRILKSRYPGCSVVFIGPCAAKKYEACRPENNDAVDVVLTFSELEQWFKEEGIDLANCSESGFEFCGDIGKSRLFPVEGGMLETGGLDCGATSAEIIHLSGAEDIMELLEIPEMNRTFEIMEPLFCNGGCINGPAFSNEKNYYERRCEIIAYVAKAPSINIQIAESNVHYGASFVQDEQLPGEVTENQINKVLESTGKANPELHLNCGACGYKSCIDNAAAVVRGLAEPEMCMPYMRRLAHQRTDRIIETSPDGVVILDSELHILKMNPAFQKMFMCNNGIIGRRISYLVNADGFEKIMVGATERYESIQTKYGIKYHEILYALRDEQQYVGLYSDISKIKFDSDQLDLIKRQTLKQAKDFLDHQIKFSQEMAHFLGKSTAQSEGLIRQMIEMYEDSGGSEDGI